MEKQHLKNTKGASGARMIHYPAVRFIFFLFFSFLFRRGWGFKMERRQTREEEAACGFSSLGHGVCGRSGQRRAYKNFLTWQRGHADRSTDTQTGVDARSCAVTFYLSILFIIVRQHKRQTGKGYDVTRRELVAAEWLGNTSTGGHFSCGVCVYILCLFWTLL